MASASAAVAASPASSSSVAAASAGALGAVMPCLVLKLRTCIVHAHAGIHSLKHLPDIGLFRP